MWAQPKRHRRALPRKVQPEERPTRFDLGQYEPASAGCNISYAEFHPNAPEDWRSIACFKLLLFNGARLAEIRGLRWEWIDWSRGVARLPDSKTGRKTLVLSESGLRVLLALPSKSSVGYVLPGERVDSHFIGIQKPWQRIRKRAGLMR